MNAIADRGLFLHFVPTVHEVHEEVGRIGFLSDPEVYEFIATHLKVIGVPSMRYYVKAHDMRRAGIADWKDKTLALLNPRGDRQDMEVISSLLEHSSSWRSGLPNGFCRVRFSGRSCFPLKWNAVR